MKGSLTATSSTSSLCKATLATKRPILPNPIIHITSKISQSVNKNNNRSQCIKLRRNSVPLIPILIFLSDAAKWHQTKKWALILTYQVKGMCKLELKCRIEENTHEDRGVVVFRVLGTERSELVEITCGRIQNDDG